MKDIKNAIAVIGMAGRFPGARNIQQFWDNLCCGVDSISRFSVQDLQQEGSSKPSHYVGARGVLDGIEFFDADFFGFNAREAELTDPQHRLFLECAWEALENAGCCSEKYSGSIGVYGGSNFSSYFLNNIYPNKGLKEAIGDFFLTICNEKDYLTTKVSYKLNLKGPSLTIQTACSTSLVAVGVACNHLLTYQCDIALAGGVSITVPQTKGYFHQDGMIFSPDGYCKPFDKDAQGTVPSNGVGIVVLKRFEDAIEDNDHIYALIRGFGINNDGMNKIGYTAPSVQGQSEAILTALAMAEINPETITYVQAHGTATIVGDPIETRALSEAFQVYTQKKNYCAIGSIKSNIGHSFESAGVAGLISAVLSLYHRKIPPSLHFRSPNPSIDFQNTPFYVNKDLKQWEQELFPRRACVSSFGIGGTNAHVVLEEYSAKPSVLSVDPQLFLLSAKTPTALKQMAIDLEQYLQMNSQISLADVAYTLQIGRKEMPYRHAIVGYEMEKISHELLSLDPNKNSSTSKPHVAFLFLDQESTDNACQKEPSYQQWREYCSSLVNLKDWSDKDFFIEKYSLAKMWEEWGVYPQTLIGVGKGEYIAACLAGIFSLEEDISNLKRVHCKIPRIPFYSNKIKDWIFDEKTLNQWCYQIATKEQNSFNEQHSFPIQKDQVLLDVNQNVLESLGKLWVVGVEVDWKAFHKKKALRKVPLPSYPFEKKRFWVDFSSYEKKNEKTSGFFESSLLKIWKELLGRETINDGDDFFLLGGDSLLAIQLLSEIEKVFSVSISLQTFLSSSTFAKLASIIRSNSFPEVPCLVKLKEGQGAPLFMIHPIEGTVFCYKILAEKLTYPGPIYGVQSSDELSLTSIEEIALFYVTEIRKVQAEGPYYILGFSFGGIVAYEVARNLPNSVLCMIDSMKPSFSSELLEDDLKMITFLLELLEGAPVSLDEIQAVSNQEKEKRVLHSLGLGSLTATQQKKQFLLIKRHWKALWKYCPKPYYGKVLFFQAKDRFLRMSEVSLAHTWQDVVKGDLIVHEIAGNHANILKLPQVLELANNLNECL